ncbi:hypothetical protein L0128_09855, partial [candidate division KSB1 bacterium]|nr:hypothetical protein [candidate division KSB1 bacterium]
LSDVIAHIKGVWLETNPLTPFEYHFLDDTVDLHYQNEQRLGTLINYFSFMAIFISCLGLFGLALFSAEARTKEIGIRKILGATVSGVTILLNQEFAKWILLANLIAWPIAYYAMNRWLQNFAYHIEISWWVFVLAGGLTFLIALLTISTQAIKTALINPVEALRYE